MQKKLLIPVERIEQVIYFIRGHKVMLDEDLARLYDVATKALNQGIQRNSDRFPEDFAFQLTPEEWKILRSQIVTSNDKHGGRRYTPYAFTEHGVVMLANVLKSKRAILISIEIARAFIRLSKSLTSHEILAKEVTTLKSFVLKHSQNTGQEFKKVWRAIEKLTSPSPQEQRRIGFKLD